MGNGIQGEINYGIFINKFEYRKIVVGSDVHLYLRIPFKTPSEAQTKKDIININDIIYHIDTMIPEWEAETNG